jgi:hypothetical protein
MAKRLFMFAFLPLTAGALPVQAQIAKAPISKPQSMGTFENGVYHHNRTGIEFTLPPDWVIVTQEWADGGGQSVLVRDTVSNVIGTVWMKARTIDPADIPALLNRRIDNRMRERNNFEGYKYRSDSVRQMTIGGRAALSGIADYLRNGQQMVEYTTWVEGEKSRVVFGSRMPATSLPGFQSRFDTAIQSAVVP